MEGSFFIKKCNQQNNEPYFKVNSITPDQQYTNPYS